AEPDGHRDPEYLVSVIESEGVTATSFVPSMLAAFVSAVGPSGCSSLRTVLVAGEALPVSVVNSAAAALPGAGIHNLYGPTEFTVHATSRPVANVPGWTISGVAVPMGSPVWNSRVLVLDSRLRPVPIGVAGELYLTGAQVARGYFGRADLTADRFVASMFDDGSRMYRTGDLVRWTAAGELEYLGRTDFQVKLRGLRIELGEIESALAAQDTVSTAVVLVRSEQLVAYIVPAGDSTADSGALQSAVARSLPSYMVPSAFVVLDALPIGASGKLDRNALPEPVFEARAFRTPTTLVEEIVAGVFADVLGIDRVGLDDDFFELGGNSLIATQVVSRVGAALNARVPVRVLFEASTVEALAARAESHVGGGGRAALVAGVRPDHVPLSLAQQRMWFLNRFDTESAVNNLPVAIRMSGTLDVSALQAAVGDVLARHESLRTVYPETDGVAAQVILPTEAAVPVLTPTRVAEDELLPRIAAIVETGFDVTTEVPLHAELFELSATEYVLVFVAHHISADGWSMGPLTRDVMLAYAARTVGEAPGWSPLAIQYADYTLWQRAVLGDENDPASLISAQADYWKTALDGLADELVLPFDRPRPAVQSFAGGTSRFYIDAELHRDLVALARTTGTTLFMVMHSALAVLLSRLSGTSDIAVGTPIAGRGEAELDDVIGMFVNTLVLRSEVDASKGFADLLQANRDTDLKAFGHADIPFERLVEILNPERSTARHPLFQVALSFQNFPETSFELPGLKVSAVDFDIDVAKFDLSLLLSEHTDSTGAKTGISAEFTYASALFDQKTVDVFARRFVRILHGVVSTPERPVGDLIILEDDEYDWLTHVHGDEVTHGGTLPEIFGRGVEINPDGIAVRVDGRSITYRELDSESTRIARVLIDRGAGPDAIVALAFPRSYEMVLSVWAVAKSGAAHLPVDPTYPIGRVEHMLGDSGALFGITSTEFAPNLPTTTDWISIEDPDFRELVATQSDTSVTDADRTSPLDIDHAAYMIYTSGSTGLPKGVVVTHSGLGGVLDAATDLYHLDSDSRFLHICSPSFDPSVLEWMAAFSEGATLVVVPASIIGGDDLGDLLKSEQVTHTIITPAVLGTVDPSGVDSLKVASVGGDVTTPDLLARWAAGRKYFNGYGPTETTIISTFAELRPGMPITVGRPIHGMSALVLDGRMNPVPVGAAGELYLAGGALARGYHERFDLTSTRFVANPYGAPGTRMYRTGDIVRWTFGSDAVSLDPAAVNIEFVGRSDFQIKIRGFRVELGEIDTALVQHDSVSFAATLGHELQSGQTALVSYVLPARGATVDTTELSAFVARSLPAHMVPAVIVVLDAVPLTPVGKLDRAALPEPVFEQQEFRAAGNEVETIIAEVFADVLGLDRVSVDESFFALGGDSIVSIQLVSRARARGLSFTPRDVFERKSVAGLAEVATVLGETEERPVVAELPGGGVGPLALTPIMQSIVCGPGGFSRFAQSVAVTLPTGIERDLLGRSIGAVLDHHDVLRSVLERAEGGEWTFHAREAGAVNVDDLLTRVDLDASIADDDLVARAETELDAAKGRLDPETGRMVDFVWFHFGTADGDVPRPGVLLIVAHHFVVDGVSWRILLPDLAIAWGQAAAEQNVALAPVGTSMRRWAHGLVDAAHDSAREAEITWWTEVLAGSDPALGARMFDPAVDTLSTTDRVDVELSATVTEATLTTVPARFNGGVNDGLLAALVVALAEWRTRRGVDLPEALVKLEGHGREEAIVPGADLSRTVGWFTSAFPVRFDVRGIDIADALAAGSAMGAVVKAVKEQLLAVPDKGMGYGLLRYLNGETSKVLEASSNSPQVSFNYLGRVSTEGISEELTGGAWLPNRLLADVGAPGDPDMPANATIDINSAVVDTADGPRLTASFTYPQALLSRDDAEEFAALWSDALNALAQHMAGPDAGGLTPSDVPLIPVSQHDIDVWESGFAGVSDIWSLAPLQSGLLFHALIAQTSGRSEAGGASQSLDVYTMRVLLKLTGTVDAERLRGAAQALLDRYPNLRTAFVQSADGTSVQLVLDSVDVPWRELDLSDRPAELREAEFDALRARDKAEHFELTSAPLMRFTLVKMSEGDYRFLVSSHHLLLDGWSSPLLMRDLLALYALRGDAAALPRVRSYRNFLAWVAEQDFSASRQKWAEALDGVSEPTMLSSVDQNRAVSADADELLLDLSAALSSTLQSAAARLGVTLNTMVQAAWGILLGRTTGSDDVVFGATVSGRPAGLTGVESMVGLFINTLPVRVRFDGHESISSMLTTLQGEQADLLDHHYLGLNEIQRDVKIGALFDTLTVFESYPVDEAGLAEQAKNIDGMSVADVALEDATHYPLTLLIAVDSQVHLKLKYLTDAFTAADVASMMGKLERIFEAIAADQTVPVGDIDLADDAERVLLEGVNDTAYEVDSSATLVSLFDAQVARTPDAVALVFEGESLTYAEFDARANRVARYLVSRGIGPESLVALAMRRSFDLMVGLYGVVKAGAGYVPVDPDQPAERVAYILDTAQVSVALSTSRDAFESGSADGVDVVLLDEIALGSFSDAPVADVERVSPLVASNVAYVLFTSGSTGRPKGVAISHRAIVNRLVWMQDQYELHGDDVVVQKTPVTFDVSVWELFWPLQVGARLVVARPDGHRDPVYLAGLMRDERVSVAHFVPSLLAVFAAEPAAREVSGLRWVFASGEALPVATARSVAAALPAARLVNLYGPTEAAVDVTYHEFTSDDVVVVPIGRPVYNTEVRVLDGRLRAVSVGMVGELYLAGVQLARAYYGRPDLSADRFVADPFGDGGRLYRTGDLVRWSASGELEYIGRSDFQVKLRGLRIELGEIESALLTDASVAQAVVQVRQDQLVAYVVPASGASVDIPSLLQSAAVLVPEYMVPAMVLVLDELPLGSSGKLDRKALPDPVFESTADFREAETDVERVLGDVFAEVLGLERVGVDDSFFALGGDSIVSIQLVARARARGVVIAPRDVFEQKTVARLAAVATTETLVGKAVLEELDGGGVGSMPLTPFAQLMIQRAGSGARRNDPGLGSSFDRFVQTVTLDLPAAIDRQGIARTVAAVVDRHDGLRAQLVEDSQGWSLEISAPGSVEADALIDRVEIDPDVDAAAVLDIAADAVNQSMNYLDPRAGSMLRFVWIDFGPTRSGRLVVVAHHLVVDGVSWRILVPDFVAAWAQVSLGHDPVLPEVGTSERRWAHALREESYRDERVAELPVWQAISGTEDPTLGSRPFDPALDVQSTVERISAVVPADVTKALLTAVPEAFRGGVNDGLLTALAVAVTRWRTARGVDAPSTLVQLEGHGREEELVPGADLSRTVGWFTSVYPVRLDLSGIDAAEALAVGTEMARAIKAVKEQLLAVPDKGMGYGLLRYMNAETGVELAALADGQISFNYLGRVTTGELPEGLDGWVPASDFDDLTVVGDADMPANKTVDINAIVRGTGDNSELAATFAFPTGAIDRADVQELADTWVAALVALAAHVTDGSAGGLTPSDVPLAPVTQRDIDVVESQFPAVTDIWSLSPLQSGLLFHAKLAGTDLDVYTMQMVLTLSGEVDTERLRGAAQALLNRYDNLRTAFVTTSAGSSVQVVVQDVTVPWTEHDLSGVPESDRLAAYERLRAEEQSAQFDTAAAPLVRFTLVKLSDGEFKLLFANHHILIDGWSMPLLMKDLLVLYAVRGDATSLPRVPSYRTFLSWIERQNHAESAAVWARALDDAPEPTLMAPSAAGREITARAGAVELSMSAELSASLSALGARLGVTVNTLVQAAWGMLLSASTGRDDVVFGATVSGRPASLPGVESMVGLFINTLPVRVRIDSSESLESALTRLQSEQADLLDHHYLGLTDIQRAAHVGTLFDTLTVFESYPVDEAGLAAQASNIDGMAVTGVDSNDSTHYPLTLLIVSDDRIRLTLKYFEDLFSADQVTAMLARVQRILEAIATDPTMAVGDVDLLDAAERDLVLSTWNDTDHDVDDQLLLDAFHEQVERTPDAVALTFEDESLTYREFADRVGRLARYLVGEGVGPESTVAIGIRRSFDLLVSVYAVIEAGGAYVPVDPEQPAERVDYIVDTSAAALILTTERDGSTVSGGARVVNVDQLDLSGFSSARLTESERPSSSDGSAYVLFTSGSTGRPKGVTIGHRAIVNRLDWMQAEYSLGSSDVVIQKTPVTFDVSVWELFWPLRVGARMVIARPDGHRDPAYLAELIASESVTVAHFVPSMLAVFTAEPTARTATSLRWVFASGEALPSTTAASLVSTVPSARMVNLYGPTEAAVDVTYHEYTPVDVNGVPIGKPVFNTRVYVLDNALRPTPVGAEGELYLGGVQLARGYASRPDLTADRFVANPFGGGRLYRTGDVVRWSADGELVYVGRSDFQVKLRGQRIELGEIESALLAGESVAHAVVAVRDDRLVAWIVFTSAVESDQGTVDSVLADAAERLPSYMVPSAVVVLDDLPLTSSGKLDRKALPEPEVAAAEYRAPGTPIEQAVADVFAEVLGVDRVGLDDDFFSLGGNSLIATQVVARLSAALDAQVPVRALFDATTVGALARRVEDHVGAGARAALVAGPRPERVPLSLAQQRMWFLNRFDTESSVNNIPVAIRLTGSLDIAALRQAISDVVSRHETMRTIYPEFDGVGHQVVLPEADVEVDLTPISVSEQDVLATVVDIVSGGFDVTREVPVRVRLLAVGSDDHVLVFVVHHIASDGFSMRPLTTDVMVAYAARAAGSAPASTGHSAGSAPAWTALPVQYADYAVWQREVLGTEDDATSVASQQVSYWTRQLSGLADQIELPFDYARPAVATNRGRTTSFAVSPDLHRALDAVARENNSTLFMVVHAALAVLMSRLSASEDVAIGTPIAGRGEAELDDLIGMFVNTLVLRTQVEPSTTFRDVLAHARETDLAAFAHADVPFERLVEVLDPERSQSRHPLVQVVLAFQNLGRTALELPNLSVEALEFDAGIAKFDLQFTFEEVENGGLTCYISYASDLFDAATVDRFGSQFHAVLEGVVADASTAVGDVDIVDADTRDRVLTQWSSSGPDVSVGAGTLVDRFDAVVASHPKSVAVRFQDESLSYAELDARVNRLARRLIAVGAGPDSLVAVALPRSADLVVALLAVIKSGAGYLPVDPTYPAERIEFMMSDAAPVAVVTTPEVSAGESMAGVRGAGIPVVDVAQDDSDDSSQISDADRLAPLSADSLAYVIYTSGSTGRPKGVLIPHSTVLRLMDNTDGSFGFDDSDVWTMFHSYAFDFSVWELWGPLLYGGTLVMVDYFTSRSPEAFRELLVTEGVTVLNQTPSAFYQLAELDRAGRADAGELSLRYVVFGGEALEPRRLEGWFARHGDGSESGPLLVNMYGITETTVHVSFRALSTESVGSASVIGAPISGLGVYVLDTRLQPVPVGVAGELYVSGGQLARGYLGRADLSSVRFVANPFGDGRLYRTGDVARWTETQSGVGELVYLGRADDQVKVRGFRIELGEVEAAVSAQPGVTAAAVIVREDTPGATRLVAYVVGTSDTESVRSGVATLVPEYMVPSAFVVLDEIPLTVNGKLDRRALPVPVAAAVEFRAPSTPLEEIVAGVFADVLGVARVGVDDDFFALGGNSLIATQVVSRLGAALDTQVPVRLLFEASSVGDLAGRVESSVGTGGRKELVARERPQHVPLSLAQRRMWFLNRFDSASTAYNIPMALRLSGALDEDAFAEAIGDLVARHETLRTIYPDTDSGPAQKVLTPDQAGIALAVDSVDAASVTEKVLALAASQFDVTTEVPVRITLFRIEGDAPEYVLAMVVHHISADGSSMVPVTTDLMTAYASRTRGQSPDWAPLPVQYADYALWQRDVLGDEDDPTSVGARQLEYWKNQLADLPDQLTLPIDKPRPADQSFRGDRVEFAVPATTHAALQDLARENNATVFMAVHAAFSVLLSRLSGMTDIAVGTPIAGRGEAVLDNLVGMFVNTLVFRLDVAGERTFAELLESARETDLQAFANADVPFERLVEVLNPARSTARHPLFQVGFSFQNVARSSLELGDLTVSAVDADSGNSQFDLHLILADHYDDAGAPAGFEAIMTYASDLFERSTVEGIVERFVRVLESVTQAPSLAVGDIAVLDEDERVELVSGWNDTRHDTDSSATLVDLFDEQVRRDPAATALVYEGESVSYGEFDARVNRVARSLIGRGVGPESLVGLAIRRSVDLLVGMYAIVKAGGAYVPIDPDQPVERIEYILGVANPVCVITVGDDIASDSIVTLADLDNDGDASPIAPQERLAPLRPENTAYVIFTSGSTGKPKGVAVSHGAIVNQLLWKHAEFDMGPTDSVLLKTVATFDLSVWEFWSASTVGAKTVVATADGHRDPDYLLALLRDEAVTTLHVVPSMLSMLTTVAGGTLPSTLRRILAIGEALPPATAQAFRRNNSAQLFNLYGPTEAAVSITSHLVTDADVTTVPIGRPEWNSEVFVLDGRLQPVPVGVSGELYLAGAQLARGYHGRSDLTADRFVASPFSADGARMYRTGDVVRWTASGELDYVERADFQVKVRGYRIELGEIETALRAQDTVRDVAVTVVNDDRTGDQLVAYVVSTDGEFDVASSRAALSSSLPSYMVPSAYVVLDALPLNTNGKLDRKALPKPEVVLGEFRAPTNPVEEVVVRTLADVLGIDRIGLDDVFFELGGNSLIATQVVSRLGAALDTQIPVRTLFEASTVEALAARIQPLVGGGARVPLVARERPASVPLSLAQQRMWTLNQVDPESAAYNIPAAVRFSGALDTDAFAAAMADVIERHEVLRTRYPDSDDGPVQVIGSVADALPDLTPIPVSESEVFERVGAVLGAGFDVTTEVPVRAALFALGETEYVFALVAHHITADGFSMRPLIRDVMLAYTSRAAGDGPQWAPLPVQYADFSLWQREVLGSEDDPDSALSTQLAYWNRELAGLPELLPLPTDHPRPPRQSTIGAAYEFSFGPEIAQRLEKTAREHNATVFMVVHSALAVLLARLSGTDDIAIGTPTAGRGEEALDDLVGMFVNTLVLRTHVEGGITFAELLARTRDTDLAAFGHADVPFERLVESMGRTTGGRSRSSAFSPLFQVMLTFQNAVSGTFALPGLEVSTLAADEDQAKFDLQLTAIEQFDDSGALAEVKALFNYATSLFTRSTVEKFADRFLRILDAVTQDPSVTLRSIDILSEAERAAFAPKRAAKTVDDLPALVSEAAAAAPSAIALTHEGTDVTFEELNTKIGGVSKAMGATLKAEALITVALSQLVPGILPALGAEGYAALVASMIETAASVIEG
ncbi:non-ribosomal peptide synthase/polyketide synthase, partial [Rhodococcoides kyotonense]